ncbi:MAG TPA: energy transducer TonB [Candidatus Acidoferrales bacterium]|nr:energy transducer TonB [Candidatus Acidoferrales bacterium]
MAGLAFRVVIVLFVLSLIFPTGINSFLGAQKVRKYPNSDKGFQDFIEDVLDAARKNDQASLLEFTSTMVLPDSEKWFDGLFGGDFGPSYARKYSGISDKIRGDLASSLLGLAQSGYDHLEVSRLNGLCDKGSTQEEYAILLARQRHEPLGVVRFNYKKETRSLRYFAYSDGAFRYLGNIGLPEHSGPPKDQILTAKNGTPTRIQIDGEVQMARSVKRVHPVYPVEARQAHIHGTVVLKTIISTDGRVSSVAVVSGPCQLTEAAYNAVIQWTFKPTLVKSKDGSEDIPVEVECVFEINFNMSSG